MTQIECQLCKNEGKTSLIPQDEFMDHNEKVHGIKKPVHTIKRKANPHKDPLSEYYQNMFKDRGITRIYMKSSLDEKPEEISFPPEILVVKEDDEGTPLEMSSQNNELISVYKKHVVKLKIQAEFTPISTYPIYSLPVAFQKGCMTCPKSFNRHISELGPLRKFFPKQLNKIPPQEMEVLKFCCLESICSGVRTKYPYKLLKYKKEVVKVNNEDKIIEVPYDFKEDIEDNNK